jgi:hypothetical protein
MTLTAETIHVGMRVRLINAFGGGSYPGAIIARIEAGETARIIAMDLDCDQNGGEAPVRVEFDRHLETLDDWDNTFSVGIDRDLIDYDTILSDWERIP